MAQDEKDAIHDVDRSASSCSIFGFCFVLFLHISFRDGKIVPSKIAAAAVRPRNDIIDRFCGISGRFLERKVSNPSRSDTLIIHFFSLQYSFYSELSGLLEGQISLRGSAKPHTCRAKAKARSPFRAVLAVKGVRAFVYFSERYFAALSSAISAARAAWNGVQGGAGGGSFRKVTASSVCGCRKERNQDHRPMGQASP